MKIPLTKYQIVKTEKLDKLQGTLEVRALIIARQVCELNALRAKVRRYEG